MFRRMSITELLGLSDEERRAYLRSGAMFTISGGDGEGEGEGEGEGAGAGGGEGDEEDDDDVLEISRRDYNALKEAAKAARKAQADKEKAEAKAAEKAKRDSGEFEEIIAEKETRIAELEAERDDVAAKFDTHVREGRVREQARSFGFKDPQDALSNLTDEDTEDDASVTRALQRVARKKPYLVDPRKASGAPLSGAPNGSGGTGLTIEMIKGMSQDEVSERLEEVQAVLAAQGNN